MQHNKERRNMRKKTFCENKNKEKICYVCLNTFKTEKKLIKLLVL